MNLRPYHPTDYESVKTILEATRYFHSDTDTAERLQEKVRRDPESIQVAELEGRVVGNIFFIEDGWKALVFRLTILPAYQRKGVGSALLAHVESILTKRNAKEIELMVRDSEIELKTFYTKRGYFTKPQGPHRIFHKELI